MKSLVHDRCTLGQGGCTHSVTAAAYCPTLCHGGSLARSSLPQRHSFGHGGRIYSVTVTAQSLARSCLLCCTQGGGQLHSFAALAALIWSLWLHSFGHGGDNYCH